MRLSGTSWLETVWKYKKEHVFGSELVFTKGSHAAKIGINVVGSLFLQKSWLWDARFDDLVLKWKDRSFGRLEIFQQRNQQPFPPVQSWLRGLFLWKWGSEEAACRCWSYQAYGRTCFPPLSSGGFRWEPAEKAWACSWTHQVAGAPVHCSSGRVPGWIFSTFTFRGLLVEVATVYM